MNRLNRAGRDRTGTAESARECNLSPTLPVSNMLAVTIVIDRNVPSTPMAAHGFANRQIEIEVVQGLNYCVAWSCPGPDQEVLLLCIWDQARRISR